MHRWRVSIHESSCWDWRLAPLKWRRWEAYRPTRLAGESTVHSHLLVRYLVMLNGTHPRIELVDIATFSTSVEPAVNLNDSIRGYPRRCILSLRPTALVKWFKKLEIPRSPFPSHIVLLSPAYGSSFNPRRISHVPIAESLPNSLFVNS